jgi:DNA-binding PadR family transcriptional regulator
MDVKTLCLGVLSTGDATGYEIKKFFEDSFSHFYVAGFGSIYPALAELTREGLVTCSELEQEKRPAKKVYHLTEAGLEAFRRALSETYPTHRVRSDFMVLLFFAHLLPAQQVGTVLQQRVRDIDAGLAHIDRCMAQAEYADSSGAGFAAGFARAVLQAGKDYIAQHREPFLHGLLKEEDKA